MRIPIVSMRGKVEIPKSVGRLSETIVKNVGCRPYTTRHTNLYHGHGPYKTKTFDYISYSNIIITFLRDA